MIDGESSKAELLQSSKCSSGDMTAVILTLTWSKSVRFDTRRVSIITLKELLLDKTLWTINQRQKRCSRSSETGLTAELDSVDVYNWANISFIN